MVLFVHFIGYDVCRVFALFVSCTALIQFRQAQRHDNPIRRLRNMKLQPALPVALVVSRIGSAKKNPLVARSGVET